LQHHAEGEFAAGALFGAVPHTAPGADNPGILVLVGHDQPVLGSSGERAWLP
jgi:hypothetical protein